MDEAPSGPGGHEFRLQHRRHHELRPEGAGPIGGKTALHLP